MKPLILLLIVFVLLLLWTRAFDGSANFLFAGRLAMGVMLIFTAIGHFRYANGMSMMIPEIIPLKKPLVYLTGVFEIVAGVTMTMPFWTKLHGWILITFFALILPANIYAAIRQVDYEKGTYQGPGPSYLWFRIPLQIFFIAWVYYFCVLHAPRMKFQFLEILLTSSLYGF